MLEVADALAEVLRRAAPRPAELTPLSSPALGLVLAQDVPADLDSPPFDKAMMDGFAVRSADGPGDRTVIEDVTAGRVPTRPVGVGEATAITTGSPLPDGADAVVPLEACTVPHGGNRVTVPATRAGANVLPRAAEFAATATVLPASTVLTPAAFGLCAAVGKTAVLCVPPPRVAVVVTGDELVEPAFKPRPGQIRNSNGALLTALAARAGATARYLGIARDDPAVIGSFVREGLEVADVLLLAGGVSAGKLDLVPGVLAAHGVEAHFHKVRLKPGKPLLFGTRGKSLVFGLPGNPGGAFVGFELFVKPALRALAGHPPTTPPLSLPLTADLVTTNDRPTFRPGRRTAAGVEPLPWLGSADLRALLTADSLIALPPGEVRLTAGQPVAVLPL
jgi:molybdopterin molybdotransferase